MLPTLSIGPFVIPTAPLVYMVGIWVSLSVVERAARRLKLNVEATYSAAAVSLAAGFIGARIVFVILHWPAYRSNLSGIVWPITSGYDLWGGLLIALISAFFYSRAKRLPPLPTLDAVAPGLISGLIAISVADFFGGPGYGTETGVPWAIDVFGITRHPVQVYEILFGIAALVIWRISLDRRVFPGQLFLSTVAIYSAGRLFVDIYRANAWLTATGFHILQIVSLFLLLTAVFFLGQQYRKQEAT